MKKTGRYNRLPKSDINIFDQIKAMRLEAEASGTKIWNLSIGQPVGSALPIARLMNSLATMLDIEAIHGYQDNGAPGVTAFYQELRKTRIPIMDIVDRFNKSGISIRLNNSVDDGLIDLLATSVIEMADYSNSNQWAKECPDFAKEFVQHYVRVDLSDVDDIAYLPVPGTKSILGYVILACRQYADHPIAVMSMSKPGYPTPATQCRHLGVRHKYFQLDSENKFLVDITNIDRGASLLMVNYPNNPSGQTVDNEFWHPICSLCQEYGIRLFNDAAYAIKESALLAEVAIYYPSLSWAESFSASKMGCNFTGHRVGALVGSSDSIADIATIKGNNDSGFYAPAAVGALAVLRYAPDKIKEYWQIFQRRQKLFSEIAKKYGMQPVVEPKATFFSFWKLPKTAFGVEIKDSKHFNELMIAKTGLMGVHLHPEYIRYAVVEDIEASEFVAAIEAGFEKANVRY